MNHQRQCQLLHEVTVLDQGNVASLGPGLEEQAVDSCRSHHQQVHGRKSTHTADCSIHKMTYPHLQLKLCLSTRRQHILRLACHIRIHSSPACFRFTIVGGWGNVVRYSPRCFQSCTPLCLKCRSHTGNHFVELFSQQATQK
jgi:hypothetical protein